MEFLGVGPLELLLILLIALIVLGPDKLPDVARQMGKAVREFNRLSKGMTEEFYRELEATGEDEKKSNPVGPGKANPETEEEGKMLPKPLKTQPDVAEEQKSDSMEHGKAERENVAETVSVASADSAEGAKTEKEHS